MADHSEDLGVSVDIIPVTRAFPSDSGIIKMRCLTVAIDGTV